MKTERRAGLAFIFVTILIDVMGFGLIIPVLPKLISQMSASGDGARIYGWLLAVYGLLQFLCAPILGNLSDRYGRRPVLLISLFCAGVDYILQALATTLPVFFLGRVIAGATGASFTAASAYIADVSPPEKRAQNFGLIGAAFGVGFIIGPALGGYLGGFGERVPFWAAAGLALVNFAYGTFVLPESLPKENRREFSWRGVNPFLTLGILRRHPAVLLLAISAFTLWLGQQTPPSVMILFTEFEFGWGTVSNGYMLAAVGAASLFVQTVVIRFLSRKIGDRGLLVVGFLFNIIGFAAIGLSTQGWMMMTATMVWTLCFVGGPAMQSMISHRYGPDEQGAVQGALTSLQSLTSVIGPPVWTGMFSHFTQQVRPAIPGSPFLGAALLALFAGAVALPTIMRAPASSSA